MCVWLNTTVTLLPAHLRDDIEVGDESALKDDGDVGSVEQLNGVRAVLPTVTSALDGKINSETLKQKVIESYINLGYEMTIN